jgi:hypothetical protein
MVNLVNDTMILFEDKKMDPAKKVERNGMVVQVLKSIKKVLSVII